MRGEQPVSGAHSSCRGFHQFTSGGRAAKTAAPRLPSALPRAPTLVLAPTAITAFAYRD